MKSIEGVGYISTMEAARRLGISRVAVHMKIKQGKIRAVKIGRNYVVDPASLGIAEDSTAPAERDDKSPARLFKSPARQGDESAARDWTGTGPEWATTGDMVAGLLGAEYRIQLERISRIERTVAQLSVLALLLLTISFWPGDSISGGAPVGWKLWLFMPLILASIFAMAISQGHTYLAVASRLRAIEKSLDRLAGNSAFGSERQTASRAFNVGVDSPGFSISLFTAVVIGAVLWAALITRGFDGIPSDLILWRAFYVSFYSLVSMVLLNGAAGIFGGEQIQPDHVSKESSMYLRRAAGSAVLPRPFDFWVKSIVLIIASAAGFLFLGGTIDPQWRVILAENIRQFPGLGRLQSIPFWAAASAITLAYVLAYELVLNQARHLWNDIRDRHADRLSQLTRARGSANMPESQVGAAVFHLLVRTALGLYLAALLSKELLVLAVVTIITQVLYELAAKKNSAPLAAILVAVFHSQRAAAGLMAASVSLAATRSVLLLALALVFGTLMISIWWRAEARKKQELGEDQKPYARHFLAHARHWQTGAAACAFMITAAISLLDKMPVWPPRPEWLIKAAPELAMAALFGVLWRQALISKSLNARLLRLGAGVAAATIPLAMTNTGGFVLFLYALGAVLAYIYRFEATYDGLACRHWRENWRGWLARWADYLFNSQTK